MLSTEQFERLIEMPESTLLDFKASMYDFTDDADLKATAKLVKDIISFCNTVRSDTSYIVIGVEENKDNGKILHGLDKDTDDAILQEKVKDKVHPRPVFHYYNIVYQQKTFGILEFSKTKYATPLYPVLKMKGLESGKIYSRQGTSNMEALGLEVIRINDWLKSLPEYQSLTGANEEIQNLIKDLAGGTKKLSLVFAEMYAVGTKYSLAKLLSFSSIELKGVPALEANEYREAMEYRVQKVYISPHAIQINPYYNVTTSMIKKEFESNEDFLEFRLLFNQPIAAIEEHLKNLEDKQDHRLITIGMRAKDVLDKIEKDYPLTAYVFHETLSAVYANIRQKAIDELMKSDS